MQGFHPQKHKTQAKNYANGGIVKGPGTGTSDDVPAMVPEDGYVMPADSTQALGFKPGMRSAPQGSGMALGFKPGAKRAQLSNGEAVLTPEQVQAAGGFQALDQMKAATHTPVPERGAEAPKFFFANGGPLDDELRKNSFGDTAATGQGVNRIPTGQPRPGASAASQIPNSAPAGWTGGQGERVTGTDFTRNVSNTVNALAPVGGALAPAVAGIARAGTGAARAASASPFVEKALGYSAPAAGFGALASASSREQAPVAATPRAPQAAGFPPAAVSTSQPAMPGTPAAQANAQAPTPATGNVNVQRQANGVMSFSGDNVSGDVSYNGARAAGFQPRGAGVSVVPSAPGLGFPPAQQATAPAAPAPAVIPQDTGGYGLLDKNRIQQRNMMMDVQQMKLGSGAALKSFLQQQENAPGQQIERDKMAADAASGAADRSLRTEELQSARGFRAGQLANETNRTGVEGQKAASEIEARGFEVSQAKRMQKLQDEYLNADTDEKRAAAAKKLQTLNGKQDQANRFTVVPGGQEFDATAGVMRNVPARVLNNQTGQFVDGAQQAQSGPKAIKSQAERDALPKGATYIGPDGVTRTKS